MQQFPPGFIEHIKDCDGFHEDAFKSAHEKPSPVSIRVNPKKGKGQFINNRKVPWCENGFYLEQRPSFTLDPLLHAGAYYVQEASSMFTGYLIKHLSDFTQPLHILDLCAAPGGKSTLIAGMLPETGLLVSNEVIKTRVHVLKENLFKWGDENVVITNNDPVDFSGLKEFFDVIVIDAPCSGSGLFRKDPTAMDEWSMENVQMCSRRQTRIIEDVVPALKQNGLLIYSTCSYSKEEDEDIVQWAIESGNFEIAHTPVPPEWGIIENKYGYRFYPDQTEGEGFFISALKKIKTNDTDQFISQRELEIATPNERAIISKWIDDAGSFEFFKIKENLFAIRKQHLKTLQQLSSNLRIVNAGIPIGRISRDELIPSHEFAMSSILSEDIPKTEVDLKTALEYLRKNTIQIETQKTGWCLIHYKGFNLGWVKLIPGRINNYYPVEWRVRK